MFERYTEKARRVIFFARYEALQFGSQTIAPEHVLLGLMREDKTMSARFFQSRSALSVEKMRREIEERSVIRDKIPQSAELHLASETKKVLAFAHEESERLQNRHIGTEHLLLGLLREERSMASEILQEYGLDLQTIREEVAKQNGYPSNYSSTLKKESPHLSEFTRDLTADAAEGKLDPLIGREPRSSAWSKFSAAGQKTIPS